VVPEETPPPRPKPAPARATPGTSAAHEPPASAPVAEPPAAKVPEKKVPGKIVWEYPQQIPGQAYSTAPVRGCPMAFGKARFVICLGKKVVALEWKNQGIEKLWEYDTGSHIPGSPVLGGDGLFRIHSGDGLLHCLDQSGQSVWEPVDVGEPLGWAAPVVDDNGNTYISGYGGGLYKVTAQGEYKKAAYFRTRQKFDSTGLIHQGILHIGSEDAFLYAIDLSGSFGKNLWDQLEERGKTEWFINSAPALSLGATLVVAGRDEYLYGFRLDGKLAWKTHIEGQMLASPVISGDGDIFVGVSLVRARQADKGKLVCVDRTSHAIRWEYEAKGAVESTPVIGDDDLIYVGDNAGCVHAVRPDGQAAWRQSVRFAVRSPGLIVGPNRLVFGRDNGTAVGLLASSGGVATRGWPKYLAKNG
jgi:outer membrane protein assembly factor BamB